MAVGVPGVPKVTAECSIFIFWKQRYTYIKGQQRTSSTRRRRWENMLVQSYTHICISSAFPTEERFRFKKSGMGEVSKFREPALNKAGSFDELWVLEMVLDYGCLEGRFWSSVSKLCTCSRPQKKKTGWLYLYMCRYYVFVCCKLNARPDNSYLRRASSTSLSISSAQSSSRAASAKQCPIT